MKVLFMIIAASGLLTFAHAQTMIIESSGHSTEGYINADGTVENSSHSTIGYARGIDKEWAASWFFFFRFN